MLRAHPAAAAARDADARTPLHLAAANQAEEAVVRLLLEAYPEVTRPVTPGRLGWRRRGALPYYSKA